MDPSQPAPAAQAAPVNGSNAPAGGESTSSNTTAPLANGTSTTSAAAPTNGGDGMSASASTAPQSIEALKSMNAATAGGGGGGGGATMGDLANLAAIATPAAVEEKDMDMSEAGDATSATTTAGAASGSAPVSAPTEPEPEAAPAAPSQLPLSSSSLATDAPFAAASAPPTSTPITAPSSSVAMQPQGEPEAASEKAPVAPAAAPVERAAPALIVQQAAPAEAPAPAAPVAELVAAQPQQSATPAAAPSSAPAPAAAPSFAPSATTAAPMTSSPALTASPRTDSQPPAKRQRKDSAGGLDPSIIIGGAAGEIKLTVGQIKFAQNVIKALKGRNEARAFVAPVDPVALNIPNYPNIVKTPMDLGTVDIKLALTAAAAKGGNKATEKCKLAPAWGIDPERDVYTNVEGFETDVRLTFQNCRTFNGPAHLISQSADVLEAVFDKQMKSLPSADAPMPAASPKEELPAAAAAFPSSTSVGAGLDRRVSDALITGGAGRPKREIHPPPPRDLPYDEPQALKNKIKKKKSRASMTPGEAAHWDKYAKEELKFCVKVIDELLKPSNQDVAWVFYDIPDKTYDFAPAYYALIKKPISLTMIQKKMRANGYIDGDDFDADMQLLFRNCFAFNQPGSDVALMGQKLKDRYEDKMTKRPQFRPYMGEDDMDEDEPDEATLLARALREQIDILSSQAADLEHGKPTGKALALAKNTLSALGALPTLALGSSASAVKKEPKRRKSVSNGDAAAPKKPKKKKPSGEDGAGGSSHPKKAKKPKKPVSAPGSGGGDDDDIRVVTYDQKEELAQKITELPEDRLEGALKIIAEDKPHSANDDEEIELDIDDLSPRTLYRLYRYVVRPKDKKTTNSNPAKSSSDGRKRGTGGKKRKNLDEDEESERIRKLQAQLQQFEGGTGPHPTGHDDLVASESSGDEEDSDESGSDY